MVKARGVAADPVHEVPRVLAAHRARMESLARRGTAGSGTGVPLYPAQAGGVVTTSSVAFVQLYRGRFIADDAGVLLKFGTWTTYSAGAFAQGQFYAQLVGTAGTYNFSTLTVGPVGGTAASDYGPYGYVLPQAEIGKMITVGFYAKLNAGASPSSVSALPISCMNCPSDLAANPI